MPDNPFIDVENRPVSVGVPEGTDYTNSGGMAVGKGSKVFRMDQRGQWMGAETFEAAPYSVSMEGHIKATSADFSGAGYTKIVIFKQDGIPTSVSIGDIWFDTNDTNKIYRAGAIGATTIAAGQWELVTDTDVAQALEDAADALAAAELAQATADGKIVTFYQDAEPLDAVSNEGDLWVDTNDDKKLYRYNGTDWILIQDEGIAQAIADAGDAQSTADGKIVTFYQNTQPTGVTVGDLWVDTGYEDTNTKLLLHLDGADGAVTTTDFSSGAKVATFVGTAQIDTAQSKFGGASLLLDGNSDWLTFLDSADWNLGTGDFTIDCWIRFADPVAAGGICQQRPDADNLWYWYYDGTNLNFYVKSATTVIISFTKAWTPVHSTWYHVALTRNGNNFRVFVGGVQLGTTEVDDSAIPDLASVLYVGKAGASTEFGGWIDEFRLVKGVAKWTANFSPPTAPHGLITESNRLYRFDGTNWIIARDTSVTDAILKSGVAQVLSGDVGVGSSSVKIDGANGRIIINDGTDDRIVIGNI